MTTLFFIHIPKTAGTSFRKSAENFFRQKRVLYHYAPESPATSSLVKEWVLQKQDKPGFHQVLNQRNIRFLSGHVSADEYVHLLGVHQSITFLRDPVQRIVSAYHRFVRHNKVGSAQGRDLRPGLLRLSPPRLGYVGFHFDFKKPLKAGVEVSVAVAETGQILGVQKVGAT